MTRRRYRPLKQLQQDAYKVSRLAGDLDAASRGPASYIRRRLRRSLTRAIFNTLGNGRR